MKDKVKKIVSGCVKEESTRSGGGKTEITDDTVLIGGAGLFDSMALITLLTSVERKLQDELNLIVIIADEKAYAEKDNPFRTVNTLTEYIVSKLRK